MRSVYGRIQRASQQAAIRLSPMSDSARSLLFLSCIRNYLSGTSEGEIIAEMRWSGADEETIRSFTKCICGEPDALEPVSR